MFEPTETYDPEEEALKELLDPEEWEIIEKWKNPKELAREIIEEALKKTGLTCKDLRSKGDE